MANFLCFNGDGPYWDNVLLIPGYPSGYSYLRPFRYRDSWVQKHLLKEIQNKVAREKLVGTSVILSMRFRLKQKKWSLIPIRKAIIRNIDPMPDNQSIYFSMGALYDFKKAKSLSDACINIKEKERDAVGEALFFTANLEIPLKECENDTTEDAAWVSLVNLIAGEKNLPIRKEAKRALFIRFRGISGKEPSKIGTIYKSWSSGEMHGTILSEGESYELTLYHRVPWLLDQNMSLEKSLIKYKVPSGNLELSISEEDLTGNYQKHIFNVAAIRPSGTWEEIIVELPEKIKSQDGEKIYTANPHIPLKVEISHWHRFKQIYIWLLIVWLSLFASSVIGYILDKKTNLPLIITSALISVLSAIGIYMIQQRGKTR
jgi:hypothetical protein